LNHWRETGAVLRCRQVLDARFPGMGSLYLGACRSEQISHAALDAPGWMRWDADRSRGREVL